MKRIALLLVAVVTAAGGVAAWARTSTHADAEPVPRSAKEVRGASPYGEIKNEPPPKLFVDDPLPEGLAQGIVWIQWRVGGIKIVPGFWGGAPTHYPPGGGPHPHAGDAGGGGGGAGGGRTRG